MKTRWMAVAMVVVGVFGVSCVGGDGSMVGFVLGGLNVAISGPEQKECEKIRIVQVPIEEEVEMGGAVALNWVAQGGGLFIDEPKLSTEELKDWHNVKIRSTPKNDLTRYINQVGRNLAAQSNRPMLDWTFGVLNSDSMNAFSAPGGYVLVTRGVLLNVDNEAQLAGVLAHEISHITRQHAIKTYRKVREQTCVSKIITGAGQIAYATASGNPGAYKDPNMFAASIDNAMGDMQANGFPEADEFDADLEAAALMINAGYNPNEYIKLLGKVPPGSAIWSHHPSAKDRQDKLTRYLTNVKKVNANSQSFSVAVDFDTYPAVPFHGELAAARNL